MKVWVVEWRSAAMGDPWTDIKGVFSTKAAADAYAEEVAPRAKSNLDALFQPYAFVHEFTLDETE